MNYRFTFYKLVRRNKSKLVRKRKKFDAPEKKTKATTGLIFWMPKVAKLKCGHGKKNVGIAISFFGKVGSLPTVQCLRFVQNISSIVLTPFRVNTRVR
jgi:hypothetical protein